jgi:hypothetical protein
MGAAAKESYMASASTHRWRFFRAGGFDQVRLDTGDDIASLAQLDQKLWVALSCPTHGVESDEKTLALIDADKDGRIRAPDVIAAGAWACSVLTDGGELVKRRAALPLASIRSDGANGDEAKRLLASAKQILKNLGKGDAKEISVDDLLDTAKIFAATKFNGDGIVPADSAEEPAIATAISDAMACVGSEPDRSGAPGISKPLLDKFFSEAEAYAAWWKAAEGDAANVLPLGEATAAAFDALEAVRSKVDDYFSRCRLAAFDTRSAAALNGDEAEYPKLALLELKGDELKSFPLAKIEAAKPLPLDKGINPAWTLAIEALRKNVVTPLLSDRASLSEGDWAAIVGKLAPFQAWRAAKAGALVEKLGLERVRALVEGNARSEIGKLIDQDEALRPEAESIASVEKLVRYYRDLHQLLENFVNFRDFYSRKRKALFQAGTLYLDARSYDLCVRVSDPGAHAALATLSKTYLAYCECTRKATGEKLTVAVAVTGGDSDNLMVGRNGVFYDRKGNDWDATIVKIVEHAISIRQAFWLPYKRVGKLIGAQIEKVASARDKEMHEKAAAGVVDASSATEKAAASAPTPGAAPAAPVAPAAPAAAAPAAPGATPAAQAFDIAKFAGIFAAIGIAIGMVGSAIAAIATGFLNLKWWQMPLVVVGVMLLVSGPSMILAWLKLRQRNLGPILDANGWAVNGVAKMNIPFGGSLTALAALPANSERSLDDPFAEKKRPWAVYIVLLALLAGLGWAWSKGYVRTVLGWDKAPAASTSAASSAGTPAPSASK